MVETVLERLKGVNAYPIPMRTLMGVMEHRGLYHDDEATQEVMRGAKYNLAIADLLMWLALAPDVSQGGQSYSFTNEQRVNFRNRARALYDEFSDDEATTPKPIYGYKGSRL